MLGDRVLRIHLVQRFQTTFSCRILLLLLLLLSFSKGIFLGVLNMEQIKIVKFWLI